MGANEFKVGDKVQINGEGPEWTVFMDEGPMYFLARRNEDDTGGVLTVAWKPISEELASDA